MLYVTDPTRSPVIDDGRLWRIDPGDGGAELLASVPFFINGIAFDASDRLYLASTHDSRIYVCDLEGRGVTAPEPVIDLGPRMPDGMAFDSTGALVVGAIQPGGQGVIQTWSAGGELLDEYAPAAGDHFTNVAFDGRGGLVIAASDREEVLLVPDWGDPGLPLHPRADERTV
jgi:sugar lactone lactonase YvrE